MGPVYRIYHPGKRRFNPLKNTVKFLSFCQDRQIHKEILRRAPANVIKGICNAAINCQRGEVKLSPEQKRILHHHRNIIQNLVNKGVQLEGKRRFLVQHGGTIIATIMPVILSTFLVRLAVNYFRNETFNQFQEVHSHCAGRVCPFV